MAKAGFEVYEDDSGEWRWRLRARNGRVLAAGGESFASRSNVFRSLKSVRKAVTKAKVKAATVEAREAEGTSQGNGQ
jgi:uncharacterized protein YegP (UPF0339 family)